MCPQKQKGSGVQIPLHIVGSGLYDSEMKWTLVISEQWLSQINSTQRPDPFDQQWSLVLLARLQRLPLQPIRDS